ncbi:hypothetical protein HYPSUDRAFT_63896 [Hypholoma sublateritium FD-334 SS-4]|uniref:F-box domain-containing protein n=1 Tax=Hypholoma sublateritium (strain FD-334 SS-4) TaxID=945553 RepID=A0A0D2Q589_HYPSF|nr:hypothetical protein HYPSUDRAFT_63896 [Hypholoma sublateritium FD-334 SS-4]
MARIQDIPVDSSEFPFNVAHTCELWRDVVLECPENWINLEFDLAYDPHPLLDAIAASKTLLFSVHVFTTANELTEARKLLENKRARAVVQSLLVHAERCTSIFFDLTYASSLTSPALFLARIHPELTELILDYASYDLPRCYEGTQIKSKPIPLPLKKLRRMSMCGSAFMDIIHLGTEWLHAQSGSNQVRSRAEITIPTLHLRDFEFPACNDEMIDKEYTFARFIHLLHFIVPWDRLHFETISLAYRPHSDVRAAGQHDLEYADWSSLTLENVSRDFITEFFQIGNLDSVEYLYFISCSVPPISGGFFCANLSLSDAPVGGASFSDNDDSLYNLLSSWKGSSLALTACPTFDDKFIHWLADDRGDGECEAYGIRFLDLKDCQNFTASALRRLVAAINDPVKLDDENWDEFEHMETLTVYGRGPRLTDEDLLWFNDYSGETSVTWHVENDDGYTINQKFGR